MEYAVVAAVALLASALSLFSGFGLGTLLMPVFAVFFPVSIAVAATAVVHLAHNVFRVGFVGRRADIRIAAAFALPAAAAAILGALLLRWVTGLPELASYTLGDWDASLTVAKVVIAALITAFALFDLLPRLRQVQLARRYLPAGGALSGFFGGLSGHQGALRSAFLSTAGLSAAAFIGTASIAALVVDVSRLAVYGVSFFREDFSTVFGTGGMWLVGTAVAAAFVGNYAGSRMIDKVTIDTVRTLVGAMLIVIAVGLASGLI